MTKEEIDKIQSVLCTLLQGSEVRDLAAELIAGARAGLEAQAKLSALQRELEAEQNKGQEVHDYLVSTNPDNQHLSVLEAVIQQRGVENQLRNQLSTLQAQLDEARNALQTLSEGVPRGLHLTESAAMQEFASEFLAARKAGAS